MLDFKLLRCLMARSGGDKDCEPRVTKTGVICMRRLTYLG